MKTLLELLRDSALASAFHVAPRFATVLIFILIGRLAGPAQAGIFSLATTYLLIMTTVMQGIDDLLIRQVARETTRAANYLSNFLALRLLLSIGLYAALLFIIQRILNYPETTTIPIAILTFSVFPDSITFAGQSVLLGQRRFGAPALILGLANLFKLTAGAVALWGGGGLLDVAWIWLIGSGLAMVMMVIVVTQRVGRVRATDWLNLAPLRAHWRVVLSFTAITTLIAVDSQTDIILLSIFGNEAAVGWYSAATTIAFSLLLLAQAYRFAVYPLMTRYAQSAPENLADLFRKSVYYMGVLSLPMAVGVILLAPQIVGLVFGARFAPTVPALQVLAISLPFFFVGEPCNRMMLVRDRQRMILWFILVSASVNVLLNMALIPKFDASGASLARVCSSALYFALNYGYVSRKLAHDLKLKSLFRPMIATGIMAVATVAMISNPLLINIGFSVCVYFVALWIVRGILPDDRNLMNNGLNKIARPFLEHKN
jgi:O-antigen/teichoic acid export membrane protein